MSLPEQVDSTAEILRASGLVGAAIATLHGWRTGSLVRVWGAFIGFLAAPVERDLARREAKNLRADNDRLSRENSKLRTDLYGGSSTDGSSGNADGTPNSP